MVDFAKLNQELSAEREKRNAMTPEERAEYDLNKKNEKERLRKEEDDAHNSKTLTENRKSLVSGHILGPVDIRYIPSWEANIHSSENSFTSLHFKIVPENFVSTGDKESDFMVGGKSVRLVGPTSDMEKLLKTTFKDHTYDDETFEQTPLDKLSKSVFHFPASSKRGSYLAYEFSEGENRWPECPSAGQSRSRQTSLYSGRNNSTPVAKAKPGDVLMVVMPYNRKATDALIQETSSAINSKDFKNIRVFGAFSEFCDDAVSRISKLQESREGGGINLKSLSFEDFKAMPKENQQKTIEYITKNGSTVGGSKDSMLLDMKTLSRSSVKEKDDDQR